MVATWIAPEAACYARSIANTITIAVLTNTFKPPQVGSVIVLEWWIHGFDTFFLQLGTVPFSFKPITGSAWSLEAVMVTWTAIIVANVTWQTMIRESAVIGCIVGAFFTSAGLVGILWNATHASNEKDKEPEKEGLRAAALSTCLQVVLGIIPIIETEITMRVNNIQMGETLSASGQLIILSVSIFFFVATVGGGLKNIIMSASHLPNRVSDVSRDCLCNLRSSIDVERLGQGSGVRK
ncbi:hypothetical protein Vi05172_g930 [Venturia inaequalis]|nr:hypothetical protein Vi05172_g930 [Venturia inaequalis]